MRIKLGRCAWLVGCAFVLQAAQGQNNTSSTSVSTTSQLANRGCGTPTLPSTFETWVQGLTPTTQTNPGKFGSAQIQSVFNIPVIVHVIHNNEALNSTTATTGGNLNAAQIQDQINILNKDFNGLNADTGLIPSTFKPAHGKFQFNFCLAVVNPTGGILSEPGIDRIDRNNKGWSPPPYSSTYVSSTIKPNSIWDPTKYLNMWVLDLGGGLLGFATFPNPGTSGLSGISAPYGSTSTDGLVMLNVAFGSIGTAVTNSPYHKGRTATHELGHWLGLRHIWGDGTCATDYCADTPPAQAANYGCPTHPYNSGGCTGNTTGEMTMNYMDYTDDACMYMFTKDQKNRAQLIMTHSSMRASLLTSTVCNTPTITNEVGILYVQAPTYSQVINCNNFITPTVIVHNFGSNSVTSASYSYNVDGVNTQTVAWTGTLLPGNSATITLPAISNLVNGAHVYNVGIYSPNGSTDPYVLNNYNNQQFTISNSFTIGVSGTTSTCPGLGTSITASGGATSYSWAPSSLTGSQVSLSPTVTTVYTVSAANGTCVNTRTLLISVLPTPTVNVNSPTVCSGTSTLLTASGACSYTWLPGNTAAAFLSVNPGSTTSYTVIGAGCNGCISAKVSTVTVVAPPTLNVVVAPGGSLCPGGTATLTASGASTYSWNTGGTGSVLVTSPSSNTTYSLTGYSGACVSHTTASVAVGSNSLTIGVTPSPATVCAGEALSIVATGANTYTWNNGSNSATLLLTPSGNTVYTVSGTNGPCTATTAVSVSVVPKPTVNVGGTPAGAVCAGSTVQLNASGASGYTWSTGSSAAGTTIAPILPAIVTVTGSTQGCSSTGSVSIGISGSTLGLLVSASPASICAGGSTTLTATGIPNFTWTGASAPGQVVVSPATTTTYTLAGNDGPCQAFAILQVSVYVAQPFAVSPSQATVCYGKTSQLAVSGPYSNYIWMPGNHIGTSYLISPLASTDYTVSASGGPGGCNTSSIVQVNVVQGPTAVVSTLNPPCEDACTGTVDAAPTGGTAPYTFSISGQNCTTMPCQNLCPALYTLHTTDAFGCTAVNYFSIECMVAAGLDEPGRAGNYRIYPNPASEQVTIETKEKFSYAVYSNLGQLVAQKRECFGKTEVDLSSFVQGVYILEIRQEDEVFVQKVIRN